MFIFFLPNIITIIIFIFILIIIIIITILCTNQISW